MNNNSPEDPINFETALIRLEEILERMNGGTISLDESLKLYEEADKLLALCNKLLNEAEKKIELLVKNRNGELALGIDDKPLTQEFKD
ncbi:MAG: exodeoxyribonuclease VII small subunit [Candidatus Protochlamydia sp.]|nr:exodeoxyribonuclease VII small subunit [Candidatus Protochlamydia sp.]